MKVINAREAKSLSEQNYHFNTKRNFEICMEEIERTIKKGLTSCVIGFTKFTFNENDLEELLIKEGYEVTTIDYDPSEYTTFKIIWG